MRDVTQAVRDWSRCCRYNWTEWFSHIDNGENEFIDVETCLFSGRVLSRARDLVDASETNGYRSVTAYALGDGSAPRSVCRVQRSGGIVCDSVVVGMSEGDEFVVRSLDSLGRMIGGEAYAELVLDDGRFVLEPISNLRFIVKGP